MKTEMKAKAKAKSEVKAKITHTYNIKPTTAEGGQTGGVRDFRRFDAELEENTGIRLGTGCGGRIDATFSKSVGGSVADRKCVELYFGRSISSVRRDVGRDRDRCDKTCGRDASGEDGRWFGKIHDRASQKYIRRGARRAGGQCCVCNSRIRGSVLLRH